MNTSTRIHWIRVLIGGLLAEMAVFVVVIPVLKIWSPHALVYAAQQHLWCVFLSGSLGWARGRITLPLARTAGWSCCHAAVRGSDLGSPRAARVSLGRWSEDARRRRRRHRCGAATSGCGDRLQTCKHIEGCLHGLGNRSQVPSVQSCTDGQTRTDQRGSIFFL